MNLHHPRSVQIQVVMQMPRCVRGLTAMQKRDLCHYCIHLRLRFPETLQGRYWIIWEKTRGMVSSRKDSRFFETLNPQNMGLFPKHSSTQNLVRFPLLDLSRRRSLCLKRCFLAMPLRIHDSSIHIGHGCCPMCSNQRPWKRGSQEDWSHRRLNVSYEETLVGWFIGDFCVI